MFYFALPENRLTRVPRQLPVVATPAISQNRVVVGVAERQPPTLLLCQEEPLHEIPVGRDDVTAKAYGETAVLEIGDDVELDVAVLTKLRAIEDQSEAASLLLELFGIIHIA
jgi:hypothetical protein